MLIETSICKDCKGLQYIREQVEMCQKCYPAYTGDDEYDLQKAKKVTARIIKNRREAGKYEKITTSNR